MSGTEATARAAFGQLLRRRRQASGLSQEELGERAGVGVRTIRDLERARRARPYRHTVGLLAEALGLRGPQLDEFVRLSRQGRELEPDGGQAERAEADGRGTLKAAAGLPDAAMVPRQLPASVSCFTGRAAELGALTGMLSEATGTGAVMISALVGTAGVGKTATAVHWAHQVAGRFPDGQLYVNLRGYDLGEPLAAADALASCLRALGVPGQQIPDEIEERAQLYRSRLAGRRVLVVLDNARGSDQARSLLPGAPGCAAVITSRDALAGLVAADGARRLDLDVLPPAEASGLLRSLIGPRADADPSALAELAALCARLPLALRIAAELAAARPEAPLAGLVAELAESRLDGLDAGEDRTDIRAVFSWSVRHLPDPVAEAFALVSLHPGEDIDIYATAALTSTTVAQARRTLRQLHRASLMQAAGGDRYGMHDLLRAYTREQVGARDTEREQQRALTRLFDYYRAAAAAAVDIVFPAQRHRRPRVSPASAQMPALPRDADGRQWLDSELANLVAVVVHCARHGRPQHAADLAAILSRYLWHARHVPEARVIYDYALQAARQSGDLAAEAAALNGLGTLGRMKGQIRAAAGHYQAARDLYRTCGDRGGEARALNNLGAIESEDTSYRSAAGYYREAVAAYQTAGDDMGAAMALCGLAGAEIELDFCDQAAGHLDHALRVFGAAGDELNQAHALGRLGELSLRRGQLAQAAGFFDLALTTYRRIGSQVNIGVQLFNLGDVSLRQGDCQKAIGCLRQALEQFRQVGGGYGEIQVLRSLAEAMRIAGDPAAARAELETALRLAAETGSSYQKARMHRDLAESHHSAGQDEQARRHWLLALDLYAQLGAPEADQVRSRLGGLTAGPPH